MAIKERNAAVTRLIRALNAKHAREIDRLQAINAHMSADIAAKEWDHKEEVARLTALLNAGRP